MKRGLLSRPVFLKLLLCALIPITASMLRAKTEQNHTGKPAGVTLSGCLQAGKITDRYLLNQSGKAYALRSTEVKLSEHVGQKVMVKGKLTRDEKRDQFDFEGSEANEEYGKGKLADPIDFEVTSLKVVSASCR